MPILTLFLSVFTIVELNCENLFDCRHDSLKQDVEYTPDGTRKWTHSRYRNKLNNIAQTLMSCGHDGGLPDIIALCEVENDSVMRDLTRRSPLLTGRYEYVMTDSRDLRGIDVALVYRRSTFKPLETRRIRPDGDFPEHPVRDVLYVKGVKSGGDTLHLMVVHAPSRIGGKGDSEKRRMAAIAAVTNVVDSLFRSSTDAQIVALGDFNATVGELPTATLQSHGLQNVSSMLRGSNGAKGTYKYQGKWETIDHIFVSPSVADKPLQCRIHDAPWLLEKDAKFGGVKPCRTFNGLRYNPKGCSDHLPLVMVIGR